MTSEPHFIKVRHRHSNWRLLIKKYIAKAIFIVISVSLVGGGFLYSAPKKAEAYSANYLCTDTGFINWNSWSAKEIQYFLVSKGSFLKDFSENGRSAAQIIYDAAHGHGDASGTANGIVINSATGTINPIAILATIQKEEGIIYGANAAAYNQTRVEWAMGYGYTDSEIFEQYKGFTKQVEWGAWQLRYNYERASGHGFKDYQVSQTVTIDGTSVTFSNRATASLYRYTPHLQGNVNFRNYFNLWGGNSFAGAFSGTRAYQTHNVTVNNGYVKTLVVAYKNTGAITWYRGKVNLGLVNKNYVPLTGGYDMAYNWNKPNRPAYLDQASVAPGETGTFTFKVKNDNDHAGYHRLDLGLVAEGITWFPSSSHVYFNVYIPSFFSAQWQYQTHDTTVSDGFVKTLVIAYKNTGSWTWTPSKIHLALVDKYGTPVLTGYDMAYNWPKINRPDYLDQASVAPGEVGTFTFKVKNDNDRNGYHRLDIRPVAEGIAWFPLSTHAYFNVYAQ